MLPAVDPTPVREETVTLQQTATPALEVVTPTETPSEHSEIVTSVPTRLPQTVTRLCVGCGQPLEEKRPQARAHDAACRQRAYRRRKKAAREAPAVVDERLRESAAAVRLVDSPAS